MSKHKLNRTLNRLKEFRTDLDNHVVFLDSDRGVSLSNLPTHFWESIGESINDLEEYLNQNKDE